VDTADELNVGRANMAEYDNWRQIGPVADAMQKIAD
jgi:hypothetical protein